MPDKTTEGTWKLWIDTGGTFTDCLAFDPAGNLQRIKVLSNGSLRGNIVEVIPPLSVRVTNHWLVDKDIFKGYDFQLLDETVPANEITGYDYANNVLTLKDPLPPGIRKGKDFSITAYEEAPVLAARIATLTGAGEAFPRIEMKLGSTKGTNALLERKGARVTLLVTKGLKDLLVIGDQQRPDLFALNIQQPAPIYHQVIEVDERINAEGAVIQPLSEKHLNEVVDQVISSESESVAIALLNSYKNPEHEILVHKGLEKKGIKHISGSHLLANAIKLVPRANTTVVNAYLAPTINHYLSGIENLLNNATLKVMTSAGGIVGSDDFLPKDSLLSGPAGGVVGAALSAGLSGICDIISFDMGGTSTDVSRYNGEYDYQYETKIGDAHLLTPSLSIATVAAGGGSICAFDGFNLKVGPESAGSYPGPACYGCGGPLTITDVNLLLGRLDDHDFSIPLNKPAAENQLDAIIKSIKSQNAEAVDPLDVLDGFLSIANERMAETIKKISIGKGFAVEDYTLVAFGGAGGQHACDIAELLSIKKVIIPYNAGILSAFGIGNARVERFAQQEVLKPLFEIRDDIPGLVDTLKENVVEKLQNEGLNKEAITIDYIKLFLRYAGQDTSITLDYQLGKNIEERFHRQYQQHYNHRIGDKSIELESIKCFASSGIGYQAKPVVSEVSSDPLPLRFINSYMNGRWKQIPVFQWEKFGVNKTISGDCLVTSKNTTVFVKDGWDFLIDENDNAVLTLKGACDNGDNRQASSTKPDVASLELFTNRFRGIADEMGALLQRTAFSVNIKERLDFSCALLDHHGKLIVNAPHIPVHLGSMGICVRSLIKTINMKPGDIIITNHPAYGGSHLPDITLVKPVFDKDRQLIGYLANRAHHAEIGGKRPGSMPPDATNLAEEGVVIHPTTLVRDGNMSKEKIKEILSAPPFPSRSVNENLADLTAGIASLNQGEIALQWLSEAHGTSRLHHFMDLIKSRSQKIIENALAGYEGKSFTASEFLDDGWEIKVDIKIRNHKAFIDFKGTSPGHPGNFNATPAIAYSAILYVFRLLSGENIPLNEGILKALDITLPNCFLNPQFTNDAQTCPAVVGGNTETSQRLVDTLIKAMGLAACSQGTMNNLLFGNDKFGYYETIGGGSGAGEGFNGADAVHQHMTNTRITDPEVLELRYPVRLERFAIRPDSGGTGKWRGGNGIERVIRFLSEMELTMLTQHRKYKPFGLMGGGAGATGEQYLIKNNGEKLMLGGVDGITARPGDCIVIKTPGGGGCGPVN